MKEDINSIERDNLKKYLIIIDKFINKEINVLEFESQFLALHRNDNFLYSDEVAIILSRLFSAVDAFCEDIEIANYDKNDPFRDITEIELREQCDDALIKIKSL